MEPKTYVLNLRNSGMFSNVNEVVQHLFHAEAQHYQFHIDWRHSCYFEQKYGDNPWLYYFEPCFALPSQKKSAPVLAGGKKVACAKDNIITPRIADGQCAPLLLPTDRTTPAAIIEKYLRLQPSIQQQVDQLVQTFAERYTIGLHIRGLGRNHGGAAAMLRRQGQKDLEIDYQRYFDLVDRRLEEQPDAGIFLCSDSQAVIDHTVSVYGERIRYYQASRSDFGEMHAAHKNNAGLTFSPYKLGVDIVVEAYTLAATQYFVHGNSNVANFVICKNPGLDNTYIYQQQEAQFIRDLGPPTSAHNVNDPLPG